MSHWKLLTLLRVPLLAVLLVDVPSPARAGVIVEVTGGTELGTFVPGESVSISAGGPFNNITFNWFNPSGGPTAVGSLFIVSQAYLGTPAALSTSTPGFVAQSQGISAGEYTFDPGVTLLSNTQYFFYANIPITTSGRSMGTYPGGSLFAANSTATQFINLPLQDANFRLSGTGVAAVPEPASACLFAIGGVGLFFVRRLRRESPVA